MVNYKEFINDIPDFPKEGIIYRDIQPLLSNSETFTQIIDDFGRIITDLPDYWVGIESRGFIFAAALSYAFGGGLRLVRKKGKLPNEKTFFVEYGLEYGNDALEFADFPTDVGSCIIVDDVYATGGTMDAAARLVGKHGLSIIDKLCVVDIGIKPYHDVKTLIQY